LWREKTVKDEGTDPLLKSGDIAILKKESGDTTHPVGWREKIAGPRSVHEKEFHGP
jgi:hypothetical protein